MGSKQINLNNVYKGDGNKQTSPSSMQTQQEHYRQSHNAILNVKDIYSEPGNAIFDSGMAGIQK